MTQPCRPSPGPPGQLIITLSMERNGRKASASCPVDIQREAMKPLGPDPRVVRDMIDYAVDQAKRTLTHLLSSEGLL